MNRVIQASLLKTAAVFLLLQSLIISLSPAVRVQSLDTELRWSQWAGFFAWLVLTSIVHAAIAKQLPDADPYLFPAATLLGGWGLLTIWRLDTNLGARQAIWLIVSQTVVLVGVRLPATLHFLRRYKYLLLAGGIILVTLTLLFGTNPIGFGPRLWLGAGGFYFQPSEPLKLLLIVYLAAYLSERVNIQMRTLPLLIPAFIVSGLAILLLLFQRDLGTASIFIALYTIIIYLATGRRRVLLLSASMILLFGMGGYYFIDIVHSRIESWINPWVDPSGGSYQIIQAILAIANGGIEGRGPGLGSPGLIPVSVSDFIFAAIAEETGLLGGLGLLALFGLIIARGFRIALRAPDTFRRLLASGIASYFGAQTLLIIGGNIRLLPLTGVTLPFVSYGGSSLLISFIALLFLLLISNHLDEEPAPLLNPKPFLLVNALIALGLFATSITTGWWSLVRAPDLLTRIDNPRRSIEEQFVPRGTMFDRTNIVITTTKGEIGEYHRVYEYPDLAPVAGYNHPVYGQAGLESSMDEYLRGLKGTSASTIFWNHLLYGMSPPGLDIRLTIDLSLQSLADELMRGHSGAAVVINAQNGEILVMASHPTFNANYLNEIGDQLNKDPNQPLINRAAQGLYPAGSVIDPFSLALFGKTGLTGDELLATYEAMGFYRRPELPLQVADSFTSDKLDHFHVSPMQVTLAAAALSNHGIIPAPEIASAVRVPKDGWIILPVAGTSFEAIPPRAADEAAQSLIAQGNKFWSRLVIVHEKDTSVTWFIAGTPPNWAGTPLAMVVVVEENNVWLAERIGRKLILLAMNP